MKLTTFHPMSFIKTRAFATPAFLALWLLLLPSTALAEEYSFKVSHHHVKGRCIGNLIVNDNSIRYQTDYAKDQRLWSFDDLQEIQFVNDHELNLVTYEDSRQRFGGDRLFKFKLLDQKLPEDLSAFVSLHYSKPISNRLGTAPATARFEIPVKHLHRTGGCQGQLIILEKGIAYMSRSAKDSRFWRYSDLQSIGTSGPYELRLGTFEHGPLQYGDTKQFQFRLKERLDEKAYRFAWEHINNVPAWNVEAKSAVGQ